MNRTPTKKTINYAFLFLHYKATIESLMLHYSATQETTTQLLDLCRDYLRQEIIVRYASNTCWHKHADLPITENKSIVSTELHEELDAKICDLITPKLASELFDLFDELMTDDITLPVSSPFSSWDILDIVESRGCFITIINYGDYRIHAWEELTKPESKVIAEKADVWVAENPTPEEMNQVLGELPKMVGITEIMNTNRFEQ